jgi:flavodoxin
MSKKLVAFFSASGQTKDAAEEIAKLFGCDIYEIKPKVPYNGKDLDWNKKDARSTIECKDRKNRPELADKNANIAGYDTILVGFPVWWYLAPNLILTFLESYDFTGKKVVVWGISWSSGMGKTMDEIKQIAKGANVVEGFIFDKNHRKTSDYQKLASLI